MARRKAVAEAGETAGSDVLVRMSCVLSGHPDNPGPGDVVTVDLEEAERLVGLGVAEIVTGPAVDDQTDAVDPSDPSSSTDASEPSEPSSPSNPAQAD